MHLEGHELSENNLQQFFSKILPQLLAQGILPWRWLAIKLFYSRCSQCRSNRRLPFNTELVSINYGTESKDSESIYENSLLNSEEVIRIPSFPRAISFLEGIGIVTQRLWPPIFLGMFSYDIYQYIQFPNNRYQVGLADLIIGHPQNYNYRYASLSINLGGDIPSTRWLDYWSWTLILISALGLGMVNYAIGRRDFIPLIEDTQSGRLFKKIKALLILSVGSVFILSDQSDQYDYTLFHLHLFTEDWNSFIKFRAINLLADMAYYEKSEERRREALISLQKLAQYKIDNKKNNLFIFLCANYKIWSIGSIGELQELEKSQKRGVHLFSYLIITPIRLFAEFRLLSLIINKIIDLVNFENAKNQCESENKSWHYIPERGNYDCTVCDWDFVDYRSSLLGQGCLNSVLSIPQNSSQILSKLRSLVGHGPFSIVDFSQQAWSKWPLMDWQSILQTLSVLTFNESLMLNLSQPIAPQEAVLPDLLSATANYLQNSSVQLLDLTRVTLNETGMAALASGFTNNLQIIALNLTLTSLDDDAIGPFFTVLSSMLNLKTLIINNNRLTGTSLQQLSMILDQSAITTLGIANNFFVAADMQQFSQRLFTTSLHQLDISDIDFSAVDTSQFGKGLINSSLTELTMVDCQIDDSIAANLFPYIANSSIVYLNWAANQIGYSGVQAITNLLVTSQMNDLVLDDNFIGNSAVALFNATLSSFNNRLITLSLSGNLFNSVGFSALVSGLAKSILQTLRVAHMPIGDDGIHALVVAVGNKSSLRELDLSDIALTSVGAEDLFNFIISNNVTILDLSNNIVASAAGQPLSAALRYSQLERLDMSNNQITSAILQQAIPALSHSCLQILDVSYNPLDDTTAFDLADVLISPVANRDQWLRSSNNNIDFNRALTETSPQAAVNQLAINYAQITVAGARALCLVLPYSNIVNNNLLLIGNSLEMQDTGVSGCPAVIKSGLTYSSANALAPNIFLYLLTAVTLLYLLRSERLTGLLETLGVLFKILLNISSTAKNQCVRVSHILGLQYRIVGGNSHQRKTGDSDEVISISSHCRSR